MNTWTLRSLLAVALGASAGCDAIFGVELGSGPPDAPLLCPPMYTSSPSGTYWIGTDRTGWLDAQQTCAGHATMATQPTHLAVLDDAAALSDVAGMLAGQAFWIGYTDLTTEGEFRWVTDQDLAFPQLGSPVWAFGQPDDFDGVEDCVAVDGENTRQLYDAACASKLAFVCECDPYPSVEANFGL